MLYSVYKLDCTLLALVCTMYSTCHMLNESFVYVCVSGYKYMHASASQLLDYVRVSFATVPKLTFKSRFCFRGFVTG